MYLNILKNTEQFQQLMTLMRENIIVKILVKMMISIKLLIESLLQEINKFQDVMNLKLQQSNNQLHLHFQLNQLFKMQEEEQFLLKLQVNMNLIMQLFLQDILLNIGLFKILGEIPGAITDTPEWLWVIIWVFVTGSSTLFQTRNIN